MATVVVLQFDTDIDLDGLNTEYAKLFIEGILFTPDLVQVEEQAEH